ncbi:MAG TPA: hypothetical protein VHV78_12625 [Gemmatimonadaceae bacterium]|jgi:hypothetical protein|nr:hypothetical protein [Gemmatimonadaceae bacterium]
MSWRRAWTAAALLSILVVSGEIAARVDDWIRLGVPLMHTPDESIDLRVRDSLGVHGRPRGRYNGFRLNNFGFRGPDMARLPASGCTRVLVLGASETMGYYETPGKEYPAQLRDSLMAYGCADVVNAGIPGWTLKSLVTLWQNYASQFGAQVVLIYPTPGFYLGADPPVWQNASAPSKKPILDPKAPWRPRLLERLHNVIHTPDFIQIHRERRWIDDDTRGEPDSWFFRSPPEDRLATYIADLDSLVKTIRASGATPVVMTHAMRFTIPAQPADDLLLVSWHHFAPRATPETMLNFEHVAAERTRRYGESAHVPVVDVDSALTGRSALFGDFIHFTNDGSARVAGVIARTLVQNGLIGTAQSRVEGDTATHR